MIRNSPFPERSREHSTGSRDTRCARKARRFFTVNIILLVVLSLSHPQSRASCIKCSSATSASNSRLTGSDYQLELEQLIDTFRRSVLLADSSPLTPHATPLCPTSYRHHRRDLHHKRLRRQPRYSGSSSSEEYVVCSENGKW